MIRKTLLLISLLDAEISFAAPRNPTNAPVEIVNAAFGIFDDSTPGEFHLDPTDIIPRKVGQRFGWVMEVRTDQHRLAVREEFLQPGLPKIEAAMDPLSENLNIPNERHIQAGQRQLVPVNGKIYGVWVVGPNELAGHRLLHVVIEEKLGTNFEYEVK